MVFEVILGPAPGFVTRASELPDVITGLRSEKKLHEDTLRVFCKETIFRLDSSNNWKLRGFSKRELYHVRKLGVKLRFADLENFTAERFVAAVSRTPNIKDVAIDCEVPDYSGIDWVHNFIRSFPEWLAGFKAAQKIVLRFPWLPKCGREDLEAAIDAGLKRITIATGISGRLELKEDYREAVIRPGQRQILEDHDVSLRSVLESEESKMRLIRSLESSHFRETWVWEAEQGKDMDFSGLLKVRTDRSDMKLIGAALEEMRLEVPMMNLD